MVPPPLTGWFILAILWLNSSIYVLASPVLKQRGGENIDQLFKNSQGLSPCDLLSALTSPCTSSGNITAPTPSACSCNNAFFNVRSACLLSEGGSSSAPKFSDWFTACQNDSITVTTGYPSRYQTSSNDVPAWALVSIGSSGLFDYSAAVNAAKPSDWTTLQILLPILSAGITLLSAFLVFIFLRNRTSLGKVLPRRAKGWFKSRSPARIRTTNKSDSWTIDRSNSSADTNLDNTSYPHVEYGSSTHIRQPSEESWKFLDKPLMDEPEMMRAQAPGTWDRITQTFRHLPDQIQMPFKPRAVGIQDALPTRRFRINSLDASSAGHSQSSARRSGRSGRSPEEPPPRWRGIITDEDQFPGSSEPTSIEEEEEESLISPSERTENDRYLTNRNTANYSNESSGISSGIVKIEPPTPTASSRDSTRQSLPPGPPPASALPPIPPPPRIPPPSPPSFAPRLSPIPQAISQESLNIISPSGSTTPRPKPVKQPSADSVQMSLLSPVSTLSYQTSAAGRPRRQRSIDDSNDDTASIRARPMGARSPSRSLRQLSIDSDEPGTPSANGHTIQPQRPQHRRALSDGNEGPDRELFQPLAVPFMHRRNYSSESITPPPPGDPIHLFPASVRSAGYGSHLTATESSASLYSSQTMDTVNPQLRIPPDTYQQRSRT